MASFVGTNKEFHRYIGPRLKNSVNQFTKNYKYKFSACEHCKKELKPAQLESAHVHGKGRNEIINLVLEKYSHNGVATVDLIVFEEQFKEEHYPLEKSVLILCRPCHKEYDKKQPRQKPHRVPDNNTSQPNNGKVLPIILEPSDPDIFKQELLKSKRALMEITYSDGEVELKMWKAEKFKPSSNVYGNLRTRPEFRSGEWQKRGIVKIQVKVIKNT